MNSKRRNLQKTIRYPLSFSGNGLHFNRKCLMIITPAPANYGIRFCRDGVIIPALAEYVVDTSRSTSLAKDGKIVQTVEHVLSGLWGMGIDNASVSLSDIEPPMLDNASSVLCTSILEAGITQQDAHIKYFKVSDILLATNRQGDFISANPGGRETVYTYEAAFPEPIGRGKYTYVGEDPVKYYMGISRARTFGEVSDVWALKSQGLSLGSTMDNALIYDRTTGHWISNAHPHPHMKDEPIRHKVLDLMGDMALAGRRIKGHILAHTTGHALQVKMAQTLRNEILEDEDLYT